MTTTKFFSFAAATFACATIMLSGAQAATISGLDNTGLGTIGSADPNYVLTGGTAYVSGTINPAWTANNSTSSWITPFVDANTSADPGINGTYEYKLTFDLTGFDATTASFSGRLSADNGATISLNGVAIPTGSIGFGAFTPFSVATGFVTGVNTLSFLVTNFAQNGGNPTGLRVEFTTSDVSATSDVPVPAALPLLASALGIMGVVRRRKKSATA